MYKSFSKGRDDTGPLLIIYKELIQIFNKEGEGNGKE
jgi:hypothetical protein